MWYECLHAVIYNASTTSVMQTWGQQDSLQLDFCSWLQQWRLNSEGAPVRAQQVWRWRHAAASGTTHPSQTRCEVHILCITCQSAVQCPCDLFPAFYPSLCLSLSTTICTLFCRTVKLCIFLVCLSFLFTQLTRYIYLCIYIANREMFLMFRKY